MANWSDIARKSIADDRLGRADLVRSLGGLLSGSQLETPLVVGVYGHWGSGKTTVMRMLQQDLRARDDKALHLWFDAWKYARAEHSLWRALLIAVIDELDGKLDGISNELGLLRDSLFRSLTTREDAGLKVNWGQAVPLSIDVALHLATAGLAKKFGFGDIIKSMFGEDAETIDEGDAKKAAELIERSYSERYRAQLTAIDQFESELTKLIRKHLVDKGKRLTVFVDDLDRCLPEDAIAALEAIKLFFGIEGCVFVLGMDRDVVERGILSRFPPIKTGDDEKPMLRVDPRQYMDKIIQIPITLPPLTRPQVGAYLADLIAGNKTSPAIANCRELIECAAPSNPRTLKRVLNVLALLLPLRRDPRWEDGHLAKIVLIQVLFPDAYDLLRANPARIKDLQRGADSQNVPSEVQALLDGEPALKAMMKHDPKFAEEASDEEIAELVGQVAVTDDAKPKRK